MAVVKKTAKPATKTTAKKTVKTATKAVAKPATPKVAKSIAEMRVSGRKMIGTIQKEFTEKFPYLRLSIYPYSEKSKSTKSPFPADTKIVDVRKKDTAGEISINGRTLVKNLEHNFEKVFGLYAQVAYTEKDGHRYYTSGSLDEMSLTQLNVYGEEKGWKKGITH
jgi:hypothetical protein